jgi:hypothetical protein
MNGRKIKEKEKKSMNKRENPNKSNDRPSAVLRSREISFYL